MAYKTRKKKVKKNVPEGVAHIHSTFNNTITTITDKDGQVVAWSSSGAIGYKGSKKSTPFAAGMAAEAAGKTAFDLGMRKIEVNVSLDSEDEKTNHIYEMIKNKIQNAPEKYDEIISRKSSIMFNVGIAVAFIPAIIACILLLFVPTIRILFATGIVLLPIVCCMIAFVLSGTMASWKLDDLYESIVPKKKYKNNKKGYKDDIEDFTNTSEILIGKNTHNFEKRNQIRTIYNKYKKYIPYEIGVLIILSIIVVFLK